MTKGVRKAVNQSAQSNAKVHRAIARPAQSGRSQLKTNAVSHRQPVRQSPPVR
jgi:hypothetical protein